MPSRAAERQRMGSGSKQRWMPAQAAKASWTPTQAAKDWTPTQAAKASWSSTKAAAEWTSEQAKKTSWTPKQTATDWNPTQAARDAWTPMHDGKDWGPTHAVKDWNPQQGAKDWNSTQLAKDRTPTQAAKACWADVSDEPALLSPRGGAPEGKTTSEAVKHGPHGPSILKEIFPDHGQITEKVLDGIPSPSRARTRKGQTGGFQGNFSPAARAPVHSPPPALVHSPPPPSPMHRQWEAPQIMSTPPPAPAFGGSASAFGGSVPALGGSYRDRLRAGGRGALQRSADAGLVPRPTHQEPGATQMALTCGQAFTAHQSEAHQGPSLAMEYGVASEQLMWTGQQQMQSDSCWGSPMSSAPQYPHMQQGPMQEVPDCYQRPQHPHMQQGPMPEVPDFYQQPMVPQPQELLPPVMTPHYSEMQSMVQMGTMSAHSQMASHCQMGPMIPQGQISPQSHMDSLTPQMASMQSHLPQMETHCDPAAFLRGQMQPQGHMGLMATQMSQLPQMPNCGDSATFLQGQMTPQSQTGPMTPQMSLMQVQVSHMENCGERSPADCMVIAMPGAAAQFPGNTSPIDKDLVALQLKAAAEMQQCYED